MDPSQYANFKMEKLHSAAYDAPPLYGDLVPSKLKKAFKLHVVRCCHNLIKNINGAGRF
jgi:hypothetical protein